MIPNCTPCPARNCGIGDGCDRKLTFVFPFSHMCVFSFCSHLLDIIITAILVIESSSSADERLNSKCVSPLTLSLCYPMRGNVHLYSPAAWEQTNAEFLLRIFC